MQSKQSLKLSFEKELQPIIEALCSDFRWFAWVNRRSQDSKHFEIEEQVHEALYPLTYQQYFGLTESRIKGLKDLNQELDQISKANLPPIEREYQLKERLDRDFFECDIFPLPSVDKPILNKGEELIFSFPQRNRNKIKSVVNDRYIEEKERDMHLIKDGTIPLIASLAISRIVSLYTRRIREETKKEYRELVGSFGGKTYERYDCVSGDWLHADGDKWEFSNYPDLTRIEYKGKYFYSTPYLVTVSDDTPKKLKDDLKKRLELLGFIAFPESTRSSGELLWARYNKSLKIFDSYIVEPTGDGTPVSFVENDYRKNNPQVVVHFTDRQFSPFEGFYVVKFN